VRPVFDTAPAEFGGNHLQPLPRRFDGVHLGDSFHCGGEGRQQGVTLPAANVQQAHSSKAGVDRAQRLVRSPVQGHVAAARGKRGERLRRGVHVPGAGGARLDETGGFGVHDMVGIVEGSLPGQRHRGRTVTMTVRQHGEVEALLCGLREPAQLLDRCAVAVIGPQVFQAHASSDGLAGWGTCSGFCRFWPAPSWCREPNWTRCAAVGGLRTVRGEFRVAVMAGGVVHGRMGSSTFAEANCWDD